MERMASNGELITSSIQEKVFFRRQEEKNIALNEI
jgi:hypothetical protein